LHTDCVALLSGGGYQCGSVVRMWLFRDHMSFMTDSSTPYCACARTHAHTRTRTRTHTHTHTHTHGHAHARTHTQEQASTHIGVLYEVLQRKVVHCGVGWRSWARVRSRAACKERPCTLTHTHTNTHTNTHTHTRAASETESSKVEDSNRNAELLYTPTEGYLHFFVVQG